MKDLGFGKKGKQAIKQGRGEPATAMFKKATSPASVKEMLGKGDRYKHASN